MKTWKISDTSHRSLWRFLPSLPRTKPVHYVIAVVSVAIATFVTCKVPFLRPEPPASPSLALFLAAVAITTWYGGMFPGLVATALSILLADYYVFPPFGCFSLNAEQWTRLCMFALLAVLIGSLHTAVEYGKRSLRHSEERLNRALEAAHMGAWDYNLATDEFWWSSNLEQIFGHAPWFFSPTYEGFFGYIHPDDHEFFTHAITNAIQNGMDYEIEHRIIRPDQSIRWINTRGRISYNKSGEAERILGMVIDITDQKTRGGSEGSEVPTIDLCSPASQETCRDALHKGQS